jgi:hypothetical protein
LPTRPVYSTTIRGRGTAAEERGDDPERSCVRAGLSRSAAHGAFPHDLGWRHPDHVERALGHVIGGVRGVYDRHGYFEEKRDAFEALAAQIERVLNPQPNVVPMRRAVITDM